MSTALPDADYVGRLIDERFTLLHQLGGTEWSSVFLTELGGAPRRKAAIKFVAADEIDAQACIAQWEAAKALSHPHLVGIIDCGRCEVDGKQLLYVVTEYADEVLSEILPERALTPDETREMAGAIVEALSYLHGKNLVHGRLKTSNISVVDDQLKLSVDGIASADEEMKRPSSFYDAPEIGSEKLNPATDLWSFGVVLVETLTQKPPVWDRSKAAEPEVPVSIPQPFFDIARECLRVDPARRLTLSNLKFRLSSSEPAAAAEKTNSAQPIAAVAKTNPTPSVVPVVEETARPSFKTNMQAALGTVFILGVAFAVMKIDSHHATHASAPQPSASAPAAAATPSAPPAASTATGPVVKGEVASRALPDVPAKISGGIHGHIKVGILVQVDAQGNVVRASIDTQGPSRYFADQALHAAQKWKFTPAWIGGRTVPSDWILHFQFAATGSEANAEEKAP